MLPPPLPTKRIFISLHTLIVCRRKVHEKLRPRICHFCCKAFFDLFALKEHLRFALSTSFCSILFYCLETVAFWHRCLELQCCNLICVVLLAGHTRGRGCLRVGSAPKPSSRGAHCAHTSGATWPPCACPAPYVPLSAPARGKHVI